MNDGPPYSVCNNTKWRELREEMLDLPDDHRPQFRSEILDGYVSHYDGEWYYHFQHGGYADIRHFDLRSRNEEDDALVAAAIKRIGLMSRRVEACVWRVYGYVDNFSD